MAKFDIADAYRAVPVHPTDRLLLGMSWRGDTFVDGALPFGLRSALKLFTAVADALLWATGRRDIVHALHYLDYFLIIGPPNSFGRCRKAFGCVIVWVSPSPRTSWRGPHLSWLSLRFLSTRRATCCRSLQTSVLV